MCLGCLSGEATWLVEWRVNLSEIERRYERHPKGNCLYKHPGIFIRMTVTHKDQSSCPLVIVPFPSSLTRTHQPASFTTRAHTPARKLFLLSLSLSLSERTHTRASRGGNAGLNVYLAAKNTLASHVRIEIMSSKESIVS